MQDKAALQQLRQRISDHLQLIYQGVGAVENYADLVDALLALMRLENIAESPSQHQNHWSEKDAVMITYGDTFLQDGEKPLTTLLHFLQQYGEQQINCVHILPFFPYSSDDGFAVKDFFTVREDLGDWSDIEQISCAYKLMADVVINHCSSQGVWFNNYLQQQDPGKDYFFEADPLADISAVVRPRTNPLLQAVETAAGLRHVWCTFGFDQIDLDFRNPQVLKEMVRIVRLYLDKGVRIFRLDAIAFLWKELGTNSLNLPQTHEVVRLLRTLIEHAQADAVIITETNIPNRENLSYFGNNNEAHWIYNFSLPPLLLNALVTGSSHYLKQWMMAMPPAQNGTTYFNFIASHDGIGLRPVEGLLSSQEEDRLLELMQSFGGKVSWRALDSGIKKPYEINIALYDALQGTIDGPDQWNQQRFICAHAIMLALEGVPALYVHSLLATGNDEEKVRRTGHNRSVNRHQWQYQLLQQHLSNPESRHSVIFTELKRLLKIRGQQPAFHPNATQFTLHLGDDLFGFWRQSIDRKQSIFCIYNMTNKAYALKLSRINLIVTDSWYDLIAQQALDQDATLLNLAPYQSLWISNQF